MSLFTNHHRFLGLLLVAVMMSVTTAWAQSSMLHGQVLDRSGQPVVGATVMVKGSTNATATDIYGKFALNLDRKNAILVISFIGYETQQVSVSGEEDVSIVLAETEVGLEAVEVVAVGYGKQKKASVVGAITTMNPRDMQRMPVRSLTQTLVGNVSGVIAKQSTGEPGKDDAEFWIRGIATFTGDQSPLVLVDGIERPLKDVDPLEIESFSVLKDASATAVYGVRGANGVVIINTKRGFDGPAKIDIRYEHGLSFPTKRLSFVDAATRSLMYNEALDNDNAGDVGKYPVKAIEAMRLQTDPELYPDVDWQKLLMRKMSMSEKVSANISGGGKFARYFTALSFYNQDGQYHVKPGKYSWVSDKIGRYGKNINYKRYSFRTNVDMDITTSTVVTVGINANITDNIEPAEGSDAIYRDIINAAPNAFPVIFKDGELAGRDGLQNPYNTFSQRGWKKTTGNILRANITVDQDFSFITKGLSATVRYAYDAENYDFEWRQRNINFFEAVDRNDDGTLQRNEWQADQYREYLDYKQKANGTQQHYLEVSLSYGRSFGKHEVGALILGNLRNKRKLDPDNTAYIFSLPEKSIGLAGRVTYDYDRRYLVEVNVGFNGSENFPSKHRMGFFPAVAVGWVGSEESFLKHNNVLTWLKVRGSAGRVGNDKINMGRFMYLSTINEGGSGFSNLGSQYDQSGAGLGEGRLANPNAQWEMATKYDLGLELGFFNSLRFDVDLFFEKREKILLNPQISEISGLPDQSKYPNFANLGVMENRGIEVTGEYSKQFANGLHIAARGNFTFARNKYVKDGKYYAYDWQSKIGSPYGLRLGYVATNLFTQEEINALPDYYYQFTTSYNKANLQPGDIRYKDLNDDGRIDGADMTLIGYPENMPEIVYGFGATLSYKNFDFSFLFQGAANRSSYLSGGWYFYPFQADRGGKYMGNVMKKFTDRWNEDNQNPHAFSPRLSSGTNGNNYKSSTWWQRKSDYLRLKNLELGYTLPSRLANKIHCSSLRAYISCMNVFTVSKFINDFWDPETGSDKYPVQRQVFIGLNINF